MSSVKIDFDDEIYVLIVLAFLPNNWEAMRMIVSNFTRKEKLKYKDIQEAKVMIEIQIRQIKIQKF